MAVSIFLRFLLAGFIWANLIIPLPAQKSDDFIFPSGELQSGWSEIIAKSLSMEEISKQTLIPSPTLNRIGYLDACQQVVLTPQGLSFFIVERYRDQSGAQERLSIERQMKTQRGIPFHSYTGCGSDGIIARIDVEDVTLHKIYFKKNNLFFWIESFHEDTSKQLSDLICQYHFPALTTPGSSVAPPPTPFRQSSPSAPIKKKIEQGTALIRIKNWDDDRIDVSVLVDDKEVQVKTVSSGDSVQLKVPVDPGPHEVKIKWKDPDLEKSSQSGERVIFTSGEQSIVPLPVNRFIPAQVEIDVDNQDMRPMSVRLYVDDQLDKSMVVSPSRMTRIKTLTLIPGIYTFELKWDQPVNGIPEEFRHVSGRRFNSGTQSAIKFVIPDRSPSQPPSPLDKFQGLKLDLEKPENFLTVPLAGITPGNAAQFKTDIIKNIFGIGPYATQAKSWAEVAEFEFLHGKSALKQSDRLRYFDVVHDLLEFANLAVSLKDALSNAPKQIKSLRALGFAKELLKPSNLNLVSELTGNLATIYDTAVKADQRAALDIGIPEVDSRVLMLIGAVATGGWSLLGDLSKEVFNDEFVSQSINYKFMKGIHCLLMANIAQRLYDISQEAQITTDDLVDYFDKTFRFLLCKRIERRMDYRDEVYVWKKNPDLTTRLLDKLGIIDTDEAAEEAKSNLEDFLRIYDSAEESLKSYQSYLGIRINGR